MLSFRLSDEFVESYADREIPWGFSCGGGNTLGELTWITKYARVKPDGSKERWHEGCRRVTEGTFSILKNHCASSRTSWHHVKAQRAAEDFYDRLFNFKWTPPGRGLWMMGSEFVAEEGSAALQNCAFLSTQHLGPRNPTLPFVRLMEMLMLGIGVGFDTLGAGKLTLHEPQDEETPVYVIEDSREGWCASLDVLLRSYLLPAHDAVIFDYSQIRPVGALIKRFGGTAAGPEPLSKLHDSIRERLGKRDGQALSSVDIVDIQNLIGKCVVAGNVRRSAELALGSPGDEEFLHLKDSAVYPQRMGDDGWGFLSNNSVIAEVGGDYEHLIELMSTNGEPGLIYMDLARSHGRLADPPNNRDRRAAGVNPCAEQTLEDQECCTLVETYMPKHSSFEDFAKTLKWAYLYAKAVTLLPTHWVETNEVMTRNRRIGTSVSGVAQFAEQHGWAELRKWLDAGFHSVVDRDVRYSEWLGVRESIKKTSVKPSGTVSLLVGVTPGVHWPEESVYIRRMRFRLDDPLIKAFRKAGYKIEPDVMNPKNTVVVEFPTRGPEVRSNKEISVWEKVSLAALLQKYWADNQVSATFTFRQDERDQIGPLLRSFDGQLKSVSFLPMLESGGAYRQMPYEAITTEEFDVMTKKIRKMDLKDVYLNGTDPDGERYCTNDSCEV